MRWRSHIRITLSIARKLGVKNLEQLKNGCILPDQKGEMSSYYIKKTDISYPHHHSNDEKIKSLIKNLRKDKLKNDNEDYLALGALCHLAQDSEVVSASNPNYENSVDEIDKTPIPDKMKNIDYGSPNGWLLDKHKIKWISTNWGANVEDSMFYSYIKTEQIMRSILQPSRMSKDKDYKKTRKNLIDLSFRRKIYTILTYISPIGFINALIDRKGLFQKGFFKNDMVKKYTIAKKNIYKKIIASIICTIGLYTVFRINLLSKINFEYLFEVLLILFLLPILGQIIINSFPIDEDMEKKAEWFIFPYEGMTGMTKVMNQISQTEQNK